MAWCVVQFPRRLGLKRKEIVFSYFRVYSLPPRREQRRVGLIRTNTTSSAQPWSEIPQLVP